MRVKVVDQPGRGQIDQSHFYHYFKQMVDVVDTDYDILFLGQYHSRMPEDWEDLFRSNKSRLVVIDCADDDDMISEEGDIPYEMLSNVMVVTRSNHDNLMSDYAERKGWKYYVMPFSLCPELMPYFGGFKDIDICMVMDFAEGSEFHKNRIAVKALMDEWSKIHDLVMVTGTEFDDYFETLARSKIFITDGSMRKAMTCKYLEAYYYGCILIGDKPLYPEGLVPEDGDYSKFFGDQWVKLLVEKMEEFK